MSLIILGVATISYFIFVIELDTQMYIRYRANPPLVNCQLLLTSYSESTIQEFAGLEYYFLETTTTATFNERIS